MVIKRVHRIKTMGRIHTRMHANALNEQYVQLSWECGALIGQAVQNVIFSNLQHFIRHYKWRWHVLLIRINLEVIKCCVSMYLAVESASNQTKNSSRCSQMESGVNHNIVHETVYCSLKKKSSFLFYCSTERLRVMEMVTLKDISAK